MRAITIGVGYGWSDGPVHKDERWQELRTFCTAAAEQGRKMAAAMLTRGVSVEDQEAQTDDMASVLPRISVARLRGSIGQFTWDSVRQHIDDSNIVVFDVTPTKLAGKIRHYVSENIWLEIGYALADRQKSVFLVHSEKGGYEVLPSDLRGLLIGHLPSKSGKHYDVSLRTSLAVEVRRIAVERVEEAASSGRAEEAPRIVAPASKRKPKAKPSLK